MNQTVKNFLGITAGLAVLALGYAALSYAAAFASSIQPGSYRSFSVSGDGKVVVVPDIAAVSFTVISEGGKDLAALQKDNTDKVNKAIAFVKSAGVDAKDIKTESYSVTPRYQNYNCYEPVTPDSSGNVRPCPPPEIVGYTINQSVSVKIRDFSKVGDILSGVVNNGANSVDGPNFTVDDPTKAQNEARAEAIKKAQASAQSVADAGGFALGRLLGIDEGNYPVYYNAKAMGMGGSEALRSDVAVPAPAIEPGSQDVTVSVTLRYEIK